MAKERDLVQFTEGDPFGFARDPDLTVHLVNAARTRFFRKRDARAFVEWGDVLREAHDLIRAGSEHERWLQEHLVWHWVVRDRQDLPKHEIDGIAEMAFKEFRDCQRVREQVDILLHAEPAEVEPGSFASFTGRAPA